ncbi:MAG: hypothetical protein KDC92_16310, partial [Bacteroidetes bacterium]|nr:hypothetical protein [Bacteroidota bacterium]
MNKIRLIRHLGFWTTLFCFIFTCNDAKSQFNGDQSLNLVLNPSFEEKTGCPNYSNHSDMQEHISHCDYWSDVL